MNKTFFEYAVIFLGAVFAILFCLIVLPSLVESQDFFGALGAGFVNPYASGYSLDAIFCGLILITWVLYERSALKIRHGWVVIPLALIPGVATALAIYLVLRSQQLAGQQKDHRA